MRISSNDSVVFLMGPTASGKTKLALEIFDRFDISLISVDSALIYRGMDIGTAKPSPETLENYPHELIDICEPEESFSVNHFVNLAKEHINLALKENRLPVLVGGTIQDNGFAFTTKTILTAVWKIQTMRKSTIQNTYFAITLKRLSTNLMQYCKHCFGAKCTKLTL